MNRKTVHALNFVVVAFVLASGPARSQNPGQSVLVSNATGSTLSCAARKAGSAATEKIVIRPGESWSRSYADLRPRKFKCQSINPRMAPFNQHWHRLDAGARYSIVNKGDGSVTMVSGSSAAH